MKLQEEFSSSVSDVFIYIISNNFLQNELLLSFLKGKIGFDGTCLSLLDPVSLNKENGSSVHKFVLIDCKNVDMKNIWPNIPLIKNSEPYKLFFALCNVDLRKKIEKTAMDKGIHGIFYEDDSLDMIPKGIKAILNGDLWYSRNTMTKILMNSHLSGGISQYPAKEDLLTFREKEILLLIACGHNSRFISDDLCISTHTVKTHIYNIYGKINVNNRLQAALWAAKNL